MEKMFLLCCTWLIIIIIIIIIIIMIIMIPRVAGFIILSNKGLRRDEISCGVYGHIYGWCMPEMTSHGHALVA